AGVDTDADRNAMVPGGVHHRLDPVFATDVARVDAQAVNAQFGNAQGDPVVEVDIRHQRHSCLLTDLTEGLGGLHGRHRYPDNVRAHRFQLLDLGYRGGDVAGFGIGHALHRDRRVTANQHRTDANLARLPACDGGLLVHCYLLLAHAKPCHAGLAVGSQLHRLAVEFDFGYRL